MLQNKADIIGMGRCLITDPELLDKVASGRLDEIVSCNCCMICSCNVMVTVSPAVFMRCSLNDSLGGD